MLELEIAGRVLSCDAEKWDDEVARRWRRRMRSSLISCCCKVAKELLLLLAHTFNLHEELIDLQKLLNRMGVRAKPKTLQIEPGAGRFKPRTPSSSGAGN